MLGVVLPGSLTGAFTEVAWLGHHVLTLSWTLLALLVLIAAWASHAQTALGPLFWPAERRRRLADLLRQCFPERAARAWVTACGAFVVLLALRAVSVDPDRPYWSVANTLAVSVLLGARGLGAGAGISLRRRFRVQRRRPASLHRLVGHRLNAAARSSPTICGSAMACWRKSSASPLPRSPPRCLSARYIAGGSTCRARFPTPRPRSLPASISSRSASASSAPFIRWARRCASAWSSPGRRSGPPWPRLSSIPGGRASRFARTHLYTSGLLAIGLFLHALSLSIADWYWTATLLLAGYVLLIVTLFRLALSIGPRFLPRGTGKRTRVLRCSSA